MSDILNVWKKNNLVVNALIFLLVLLITDLLVLKLRAGLIVLIGLLLLLAAFVKPRVVFLLLISSFSVDNYGLADVSSVKVLAIILLAGLSSRLLITRETLPQDNAYKYFMLFFIGSIPSFAFAINLSTSLMMYITYISLFILYIFSRYFLKTDKDINTALNYLFFSTIAIFAIIQFTSQSTGKIADERISGGIGDPNEFASFIMVLIPLAFYRVINSSGTSRLLYLGCLVSFLLMLGYSGSRGGILGFLGAAGVLIFYYGVSRVKQIVLFMLVVVAILQFSVPDDFWFRVSTIIHPAEERQIHGTAISYREHAYAAAAKMFLDNPIAGVGLYNFQFNSRKYGISRALLVHNTYLEILTGGGLLSFIPFALILVNIWRKLKLLRKYDNATRDLFICLKASFVSILITSFFFSGDHKKILLFLLALISSSYYISMNKTSSRTRNIFPGSTT